MRRAFFIRLTFAAKSPYIALAARMRISAGRRNKCVESRGFPELKRRLKFQRGIIFCLSEVKPFPGLQILSKKAFSWEIILLRMAILIYVHRSAAKSITMLHLTDTRCHVVYLPLLTELISGKKLLQI
jgi:hypothetical protein